MLLYYAKLDGSTGLPQGETYGGYQYPSTWISYSTISFKHVTMPLLIIDCPEVGCLSIYGDTYLSYGSFSTLNTWLSSPYWDSSYPDAFTHVRYFASNAWTAAHPAYVVYSPVPGAEQFSFNQRPALFFIHQIL